MSIVPNRITEITRRDISDALSSINLWGRIEEVEFLERLYDLDSLPSGDSRFPTARGDIIQHRLRNNDWEDGWVFHDERFGLKIGDDTILLHFLTELLHPAVRSDQDEVDEIAGTLNALLGPDGYRLEPKEYISGRPVYGSREIEPTTPLVRSSSRHFTEDVAPLVTTVARLADLDGSDFEKEVLNVANSRLEDPEYDNWDGGTYYYTLTLLVPVDLFTRLGDQVRVTEERILSRISHVLRAPDRHQVTAVVVQPNLVPPSTDVLADVVVGRSQQPIPNFWSPGQFRLFISHVTSFKETATALRHELSRYHISGFVAHETIEGGELWQREIEAGLRSMQAMMALITPDFRASNWVDQEIGWALGSGIYVLTVRYGADPHGFIGEVQGIQGRGKRVSQVAGEIFETLLRGSATRNTVFEALVSGFEGSDSYRKTWENLRLLEQATPIPEFLIGRIEGAGGSNDQIANATGMPARVRKLARTSRSTI